MPCWPVSCLDGMYQVIGSDGIACPIALNRPPVEVFNRGWPGLGVRTGLPVPSTVSTSSDGIDPASAAETIGCVVDRSLSPPDAVKVHRPDGIGMHHTMDGARLPASLFRYSLDLALPQQGPGAGMPVMRTNADTGAAPAIAAREADAFMPALADSVARHAGWSRLIGTGP